MSKDPKSVHQIQLFKNDTAAGLLLRTNDGCKIEFNNEFKDQHSNLTFNITTKIKTYDFRGAGLPPYFAGLLPEGLRLKSLIKKIKTSPDDLFSLLAASGGETTGDIHFKSVEDQTDSFDVPDDFQSIKERLQKGYDPGRNSLAGVQDKISADRISLPINVKKKNLFDLFLTNA